MYHLIAEGRLGVNWALKGGQTIVTMGRASLKVWQGGTGKGRMREESHSVWSSGMGGHCRVRCRGGSWICFCLIASKGLKLYV